MLGLPEIILIVAILVLPYIIYRLIKRCDPTKGENSANDYRPMTFGWGYFWIAMLFVQAGVSFLLSFLGGETKYFFIIGIVIFLSACGLLKKKKWGLYLTYSLLFLSPLISLIELLSGGFKTDGIIQCVVLIVLCLLWFRYFQKRKQWFA